MHLTRRVRRVLLFLATVLVPGVVLLAVTLRMVSQERELAVQREEATVALLSAQLGQELHVRLERLRAYAARAPSRGPSSDTEGVDLIARLAGDHLELPWDVTAPRAPNGETRRLLAAASRAEFADAHYMDAAAGYERVAAAAADSASRADALLMAARAYRRAGSAGRAAAIYRDIARYPLSARDAEGMPHALYAIDALERAGDAGPPLLAILRAAGERSDLSPSAWHALRDLGDRFAGRAQGAARDSARALSLRAEVASRRAEQGVLLQREFRTLRALAARTTPPQGVTALWLPFGPEPWLVSVPLSGDAPSERGTVLAVRPEPLLQGVVGDGGPLARAAASARIGAAEHAGTPLGDAMPGVRVQFVNGFPDADSRSFSTSFALFALPLVLGVTLFGAYLLWRDVRREVEAAALRSQFVSSVSHELKTPLTSIRMFAELLRSGQLSAARHDDYLEIMLNETERLTRLINNVLDFSRMEVEGRSYRKDPVSLADVVRDAARAMAYPLAQDGFDLRVAVDAAVPEVRADRDAITQAVLNLLSNALKYSGESRTIDLALGKENGSAVIRVTDRGRGIDATEQRHVFEKYYRSKTAVSAGIPGTGLGLSLVAHVAAGHGGRIGLASEVGRGSTFSLILPLDS